MSHKSTVTQKGDWRYPIESNFVRDNSISVEARLLYIIIKGFCGPNCALPFPALETLARYMDRHRKSVQKNLKELEMAGYIRRIKGTISGRFASTRYELFEYADRAKTHRRHKNDLRSPQALLTPTVKVPTKGYHTVKREGAFRTTPKSAPLPFVSASAPPAEEGAPRKTKEGSAVEKTRDAGRAVRSMGGLSAAGDSGEKRGEEGECVECVKAPARRKPRPTRDEFGPSNGRETMYPPAP